MTTAYVLTAMALLAYGALQVVFLARAILRPNREPSSRIAWVFLMLALPAVGILAYVLFGETNIGRERYEKYSKAIARLGAASDAAQTEGGLRQVDSGHRHLFHLGQSVSGFKPVGGNRAEVFSDSKLAIDRLVSDIDAATETVHLLFYIWLEDESGMKVVRAAQRAAERGVIVRVMADDLGSRRMIRSRAWKDMEASGVRLAAALPVGFLPLHPIRGRVDLRNHRKIMVIDNRITYCGSQNCADPEFRVKAKFAPWVDLMVRFEGPIAVQNQTLFAKDWMSHVDEDLSALATAKAVPAIDPGVIAQVIGTGPTVRFSAMPEVFEALMHAARRELVITTPYFVPSDSMQSALCSAARRGVETTLVLPARNDSWIVAAASRSYYLPLLDAGVRLYEYPNGLLHTKSLTLDGEMALIGSANLDRRSFDLNYENNILFEDETLTAEIRDVQAGYLAASQRIEMDAVKNWSVRRRLWNNSVAMLGPVL